MINLSDGTTDLVMPVDLLWSDEFDWVPLEQSKERALNGSMIIQVMPMSAGRPITLQPEDDRSAAMTRLTLEQLYTWASTPGQELVLTIRGIDYDVIFRHDEPPALQSRPWIHYNEMDDADFYLTTIKLLTV